jgi:hypothetical protein
MKLLGNRRSWTDIKPDSTIWPGRLQEALEGYWRKRIILTLAAPILKKFHFLLRSIRVPTISVSMCKNEECLIPC